ncbi:hypothetical protein LX36DRAFT_698442 [Colletotrichum falcatum]|nr:hypothetical protein LX36DRAFT_698442 [Colletotrichum falcatum]
MASSFNDETRARGGSSAPHAAPYKTAARSGPPRKANVLARQLASLPLIALLYSAAVPFTPAAWLLRVGGSTLFDRLFAGVVVFAACYFQWRVAGLTAPFAVFLPGASGISGVPGGGGGGGSTIRNGRLERAPGGPGFVWNPDSYWTYAACEAALLCAAEFGGSEPLRRCVVCGVLGALWLVGYHATPEPTRRWAYENVKGWLFWMMLDEMMRVGGRSYGARRRREGIVIGDGTGGQMGQLPGSDTEHLQGRETILQMIRARYKYGAMITRLSWALRLSDR